MSLFKDMDIDMKERLKAGIGRVDVTPELGVRLGGYPTRERPAESINDPLHSTALILESGDVKAALITLDWLAIEEEDASAIRSAIAAETDVPAENVIISATHTHTAPNTISIPGWGEKERSYISSATPKIIKSAVNAANALVHVKVGVGTTRSEVGVNRHLVGANEIVVPMIGDVHGTFDPTMTVIRFESENGVVAALAHYGAHATAFGGVRGGPRIVSRDWPGVMTDRVESQIHAPIMFVNGAFGDVGPRTNRLMDGGFSAGTGDGLDAVREVGYRAAGDALRTLVDIREFGRDVGLEVIRGDLFFPYAPAPSMKEVEKKLREHESTKDQYGDPMFEYEHWNKLRLALESGKNANGRVHKQTIIRLGTTVFVPFPGELFSGIALRLRRLSPFQHTLCCGAANGYHAYIPTREARHRGGYATRLADAFDGFGMVEDIDDVLVAATMKSLRKMNIT